MATAGSGAAARDTTNAAAAGTNFTVLSNLDAVDWATQVVINAKGKNRAAYDASGDKHFTLNDPLANYRDGMDAPPPLPPPMEVEGDTPDYFVAFPRAKICEVSEHIKRLVEVYEESGANQAVEIAEISPEALILIAEFMQNHMTEKLREIPKPMRDTVTTYLSATDTAWVAKWCDFSNVYDNWLLFRMVDAAEVLVYEELSVIVAAVLGECLKDKKVSELRRFFHETDANGGFTEAEERDLMKQCRQSWPESKRYFDVGYDEAELAQQQAAAAAAGGGDGAAAATE